jgi:hypothetical protein
VVIASCDALEGQLEAAMASVRSSETPAKRFCGENEFDRWLERSQEGEEEREVSEGVRGCSTVLLPTEINDGLHEFRRGIPLQWRRLQFVFQREMGEGE